ncbi:MAG: M23 family metallopeptidase [Deltaproteobacteria bacterium]|nr:M23 family metallopeptidase [Deltaproteobacteria bacterium]
MIRGRVGLALLAVPAGLAAIVLRPAPARADPDDLRALLREEQSVLAALDRHVFEARRADAAVKASESARAAAEARATAAREVLAAAKRDEAAARALLLDSLRLAAAAAPYGTAATLLLGPEGEEVSRRRALVDRLAARQAREMESLGRASDLAAAAEFRAGIERANAYAIAAAEREARDRLATETTARQALLAALEKDRALAQRHATEIGAVERALVAEIERRLSSRPSAVPFESLRGRLRNPMAESRVELPFGDRVHPTFKTVTPHPGLTLRFDGAVRNVRAVAFGRAVHVGAVRGLGTTVVLDHASGWYTVYAGLTGTGIAEGAIVREGDLVGQVERAPGDEAARLYFELRRGSEAIDPAPFMARRREAR